MAFVGTMIVFVGQGLGNFHVYSLFISMHYVQITYLSLLVSSIFYGHFFIHEFSILYAWSEQKGCHFADDNSTYNDRKHVYID